jgi:hypothetical protein
VWRRRSIMTEAGGAPDPSALEGEPRLFISHRHADSGIADVLRAFVDSRSAGAVSVFQSSSALAEGPRIGRQLNRELMEALWRTSVVVLVYTTPDHDWSYCMWECGVATHPRSPETRIVLLQCASAAPFLFADQVKVNARSRVDLQRLTNDLLTTPHFFPGYTRSVTRYQPNAPQVVEAASELYARLAEVLPPLDEGEEDEWPAFPYLRLQMDLAEINRMCEAPADRRLQIMQEALRRAVIVDGDSEAARLFGTVRFPKETLFGTLIDSWNERGPVPGSRWWEALSSQIATAAQWHFPAVRWELLRGLDDRDVTWYGPAMVRARRVPRRQCMEFDVYFFKFNVDEGGKVTNIGIPHPSRHVADAGG